MANSYIFTTGASKALKKIERRGETEWSCERNSNSFTLKGKKVRGLLTELMCDQVKFTIMIHYKKQWYLFFVYPSSTGWYCSRII